MSDLPPPLPRQDVEADVRCVQCGYNLRGVPTTTVCPECATPVQHSLRGVFLVFASAEYRGQVALGLGYIIYGIVGIILTGVLMMGVGIAGFRAFGVGVGGGTGAAGGGGAGGAVVLGGVVIAAGLVMLASSVVILIGHWKTVTPDVGYNGNDDPAKIRKVVRVCVVIAGAGAVASWGLSAASGAMTSFMGAPGPTGASLGMDILALVFNAAAGVAWIVEFFAFQMYLRWLAIRVPSEKLARGARRNMWLVPVLVVGPYGLLMLAALGFASAKGGGMSGSRLVAALPVIGCGALVCGVVALVLYWNLMYYLRREIRKIGRVE